MKIKIRCLNQRNAKYRPKQTVWVTNKVVYNKIHYLEAILSNKPSNIQYKIPATKQPWKTWYLYKSLKQWGAITILLDLSRYNLSAEKISYLKAYQGKEKYITAHKNKNFYSESLLLMYELLYLLAYQGKREVHKSSQEWTFYSNSLLCVNYSNWMPTKAKDKSIKAHKNEKFYSYSLLLIFCMRNKLGLTLIFALTEL